MLLYVAAEDDVPRMFVFPERKRQAGYHAHHFYIPGLAFLLIVGGVLPDEIADAYRSRRDELPIFFTNWRAGTLHERITREMKRNETGLRAIVAKAKRTV